MNEQLVEELKGYCLSKIGAELSHYSSEKRLNYCVLQGFLLFFARFDLADKPVLLLRYKKELFAELQASFEGITESQSMRWDKELWTWIEVDLQRATSVSQLKEMIDHSYDILYGELEQGQQMMVQFTDENFDSAGTLAELIKFNDLNHRKDEILQLLQSGISCTYKKQVEKPIGHSKLGGMPDFPIDWDYPLYEDKPLSFLAQINLSEIPAKLARKPLPDTGILYFFSAWAWIDEKSDFLIPWDKAPEGDPLFSRVMYFDGDDAGLSPKPAPDGLHVYNDIYIGFRSVETLPRAASYLREHAVSLLNWSEDEYQQLDALYFDFRYLYRRSKNYPPNYQLLGFPAPINGAIASKDEQFLFQIDGHLSGYNWADGGSIYFFVNKNDLENSDFSKVRTEFDTG